MVNMLREVVEWIDKTYPFWRRHGGRDHIWLFTHDEGACWAPKVLENSTWLTHWGRMGLEHTTGTAFMADRYDRDFTNWQQPEGYLTHIRGHACYDPQKDLVIPSFKQPNHYRESPLLGKPAKQRDIFLFFRGDVGKNRMPMYSRGVRQKLYQLAIDNKWREKHNILVGDSRDIQGEYSDLLSRSLFCIVAAGDGWSARMEDAVLHGCIPVIIIDNVHVAFESIIHVDAFTVRIDEAQLPKIVEILQAIPERKIRVKQAHLGHLWHRYRYSSLPGLASEAQAIMSANRPQLDSPPPPKHQIPTHQKLVSTWRRRLADEPSHDPSKRQLYLPRPFKGDPAVDDAFATIIQWLYSRIPFTR
ncbi:hypothetical protein Vafri_4701 [Volvox africanus]|nr:hypothetical protein Vafri_4701 [Volvox africanus]